MNTFKKIGLTALASSLVVTSAVAGEVSVAGGASIGLKNTSKTATGKSWTMGNQLTFSGSGELDNGMNVSISFVIDQADGVTAGTAPFDSHSVTVSSDSMGSLVFSGEGGSSAQTAIDTTAAGDLWNNGSGITAPLASEAGDNSLMYTLPALMDDLTLKASYSPGSAGGGSATAWSASFSGVDGLSVDVGIGQTETVGSKAEHTTMKASYAISSFTLGYSLTESEGTGITNEEMTSWNVAYTVSDDMSITYGSETLETVGSTTDEEMTGFGVSYTTGGVTLSANQYNASGVGNSATETASTGEKERWALGASFAF